ncbi:MAG: hypothetical protein U5R06_23025 [candidate division KSB1 bacterium]|nr:hypothetical protein [candidate division KSB1 bacterium]
MKSQRNRIGAFLMLFVTIAAAELPNPLNPVNMDTSVSPGENFFLYAGILSGV